jgi:hypothetical protein
MYQVADSQLRTQLTYRKHGYMILQKEELPEKSARMFKDVKGCDEAKDELKEVSGVNSLGQLINCSAAS